MVRVPYGHVLVRPDAAASRTAGGIEIATVAQEQPPSGVVVLTSDSTTVALGPRSWTPLPAPPVLAEVGDRVHFKRYSGVEIELLLPSTPLVARCHRCDARDDAPDLLRMCPKASDARTGDAIPHDFGPQLQEAEQLLVLDLRDVVLVIPEGFGAVGSVADDDAVASAAVGHAPGAAF